MIEDLWYKNSVVYSLDVDTFMDGNGDGVGDLRGLIEGPRPLSTRELVMPL